MNRRLYRGMPTVKRFEALIEPGPNGCWIWTQRTASTNYGKIPVANRRSEYAHRWSYEYHVGPIPAGLELDHLCRTPMCVNPWHLEPVTHKVNMERTPKAQKSECSNGHPYNDLNTYWKPNGCRDCRECRRIRDRKRRPPGSQAAA